MVLRLLGAAILSLCGVLLAAHLNRRAECRLRQVEGWISLLRFVKAQVECFSLPMSEILLRCDRGLLQTCGYSADIAPKSFSAMIEASGFVDGECARVVRAFAEEFGKGYREEEMRGCDYYLAQLEVHKEALAKKLPAQKKMNATLSVCAALALVLLLL